VSGSDSAQLEFRQRSNGLGYDLFVGARKVKPSHHGMDERSVGAIAGVLQNIHNPGVRTNREYYEPGSLDIYHQEPLVQEQGIRLPTLVLGLLIVRGQAGSNDVTRGISPLK